MFVLVPRIEGPVLFGSKLKDVCCLLQKKMYWPTCYNIWNFPYKNHIVGHIKYC